LGVSQYSTNEEIRKAYKALILQYHPDKPFGNSDRFQEIIQAYQILKNKNCSLISPHISFYSIYFFILSEFSKSKSITINIKVSIEDIYKRRMKKITVNTNTGEEILYISLINYQDTYVFKAHGDLNLFSKKRGDIHVILDIDNTSNISVDTVLNRYDLVVQEEMSLYDY